MSEKKPFKEAFGKIAKTLAKIGLPALGTAIGGPAGGILAGTLGSLLGVDAQDTDALESALANASPETLVKLREIEASVALAEQETARTEIDAVTQRWQADTRSSYWLPNNIRPLTLGLALVFWIVWNLLSAAVVAGFFWYFKADTEQLKALEVVSGFFITIGMQISGVLGTALVGYYGVRSIDKRCGVAS